MTWYALSVTPTASRREAVIAALVDAGALGVEERGDELVSHFRTRGDAEGALVTVQHAAPGLTWRVDEVPDSDWSASWREHLRAFTLGSLTVTPPWLSAEFDPAHTVIINPGMAFGTGDHASTRGALRLLQRTVRAGDVVADLGAGSAVLAIGAAKLGARRVVAIELDPEALGNASENIERNGVGDRVHLLEGGAGLLLPLVAPFDVIVANILAPVIRSLLPVMATSLTAGGRIVIAGILADEAEHMRSALHNGAWRISAEDSEEGWWSAAATRA